MAIPAILKGDDSGDVTITLADGHSYEGATLVVVFNGVTREFTNLTAGGSVVLAFTADETAGMPLGTALVNMRLVGANGGVETVGNADARVKVTDCVAEVNAGGSFAVTPGGPLDGVEGLGTRYTGDQLRAKINEVIAKLGGTVAALVLAALPCLGGALDVKTAQFGDVYNDAQVVTNVELDVYALTNGWRFGSDVDLTKATNYTDRVLGAFASTGAVVRATVYGTPTRWTDATGCVWEVTAAPGTGYEDWDCSGVPDGYSFLGIEPLPESTWRLDLFDNDIDGFYAFGAADAAYLVFDVDGAMVEARAKFTITNLVGRVAMTSDIPDVSGYATQQQATNAAVAVADAKISTNNAAFVAAVTKCPVSHQGGGGADWPIGDFGQYGTIGAIIAALVAASTWLKSHLRYELHDVVLTGGAGTLLDRAGNRVVVSGDTTLTLPAANPGYLRDFLVRLEISGSTVPTITFAAPTGETIVYETDGDEFPVPDEAVDWLYSFTESCVAHKFAVSLKKVSTVAQGGS